MKRVVSNSQETLNRGRCRIHDALVDGSGSGEERTGLLTRHNTLTCSLEDSRYRMRGLEEES